MGFPILRKIPTNAGLFLASCLVVVALAEGVLRIVFNPGDHLKIDRVPDPVLGYRIPSGVNGHDANGFRNPEVPETVDILAVGDSMTYGEMAASTESWPAHLARITGKSVYNAGLGGYGPLEYLHLVRTLAPELKPERIVVMVYPHNDPGGAYRLAHRLEYWKGYRNSARDHTPEQRQKKPPISNSSNSWLDKNSMLWRANVAVYRKIGQRMGFRPDNRFPVEHLGNVFAMRTYVGKGDESAVIEDPKIVEGLAITKRALGEIAALCEAENIDLHVALMPAHPQIFYPFVRDQLTDLQDEQIKRHLQRLENMTSELTAFLSEAKIPHTDLYDPMVRAFETRVIYPAADIHPNGAGYRVVAEALAKVLDRPDQSGAKALR